MSGEGGFAIEMQRNENNDFKSDNYNENALPTPSPATIATIATTTTEDSISHSADQSYSGLSGTSFKSDFSVGKGEVEDWSSSAIRYWLANMGLEHYYEIFTSLGWDNGEDLIKLKESVILREAQIFFTNIDSMSNDKIKQDIKKIMREIEKLQINEYEDIVDEVLSVDDIREFGRRLAAYAKKWERIAWIEEYVEDWDGRLPTTTILEEELDIPIAVATELLSTYGQKEKEEEIDLNKLFEGFDISEHGVIWWSIVLDKLQLQTQDSLWTILRFVLRELSTKVCIRLLEHFKFELTRFESIEIDRLCQAIVFGSLYPMCTAIRLSGYMSECADRDLSRQEEFTRLADDYAKLAIHLLREYTESDHLAAILLEMHSDIDGLSAIKLAVEYQVIGFVSDKRIERISSTLYRTWRFLHIENKDEAFKVRPLNLYEMYDLFKKDSFYFTPVGQFVIETLLFVFYLLLFTFVTNQRLSIYISGTELEILFWILNWGYIVYELWDMLFTPGGFSGYISDWTNKFDFVIGLNFLIMMAIRGYILLSGRYPQCLALKKSVNDVAIPWAAFQDYNNNDNEYADCMQYSFKYRNTIYEPNCMEYHNNIGVDNYIIMDSCKYDYCCQDTALNILFSVLWILAVAFLYLRVLHILTMSKTIGPFVNMIINMLKNFANFLFILLIFWIGAILALVFIAGDTPQYSDWWMTTITTWRALLGEWPVIEIDNLTSSVRLAIINLLLIYWMMIGAIVLLNLLIALMAKTFDDIHEQNNQQVQFIQVQRIYGLDGRIAVMPPPLFLLVIIIFFFVKIIDILFTVLFQFPLPMKIFMPGWLRAEGRETNLSGTNKSIFDEKSINNLYNQRKFTGCCGRCLRAYFIANQRNQQRYDWVCKFCRQRTMIDYSRVSSADIHISYSDLQSESELVFQKTNSQNLDAVQRLGDRLGLDNEEIVNVRRLQPKLCQRCYRYRLPITRTQLQMEYVSYWTYYFFIRWWCIILLFILRVLHRILFATDIKSQFSKSFEVTKSSIAQHMTCKYSQDVIKVMPGSKEIKNLFTDNEIIWYLVKKSRYELTPRTIRRIVDYQILKRAHDRDYDLNEFYNKICGKNKFTNKRNNKNINNKNINNKNIRNTKSEWKKIEYAAKLWFKTILNNTRDSIHLSHTKLFPFSAKLIEAHIESSLNETSESNDGKDGKFDFEQSFSEKHLADYLPLLYVIDPNEQQIVISNIQTFGNNDPKFTSTKGKNASLWHHFIHFLYEVRKLIARVRRIENMIRDCEDAAKAHGNDAEIYLSHFHLVFEDIQNDAVATVIFRSIDQENKSIPYWKVRYFLIALKQMRRNVDRELLEKSRYTQVSRAQFLDIVLRRVKARDDDSDDDDLSDDDQMRDDTELAKREIQGIRNEGDKIFTRIWVQNELKITLTQIREYMRKKICKDLKDKDSLSFIKQRLERYIKKNNLKEKYSKKNIAPLPIELFTNIMTVNKSEYLQEYQKSQKSQKSYAGLALAPKQFALFNEDDVPKIYNLNQVYAELIRVYSFSENPDRQLLTVLDAHNLIFIVSLMNERIKAEIKSRGHDLELTQELFIKTMEKKMYGSSSSSSSSSGSDSNIDKKLNFNYNIPFEDWSEVARHSASVFQQVHDEEQNKVTLGQVRETLRWIHNDLSTLVKISKFKKKLDKKKRLDEMVDHHRFWAFIVNELGVEDDSLAAIQRLQEENNNKNNEGLEEEEDSLDSHSENSGLQRTQTEEFTSKKRRKSGANKTKASDDFKKRKLTNYERSARVFDLMENQNGLWITMRQIHVYLKWLTEKLQSIDMDWTEYTNNPTRINEKTFKTVILEAAYKDRADRDVILTAEIINCNYQSNADELENNIQQLLLLNNEIDINDIYEEKDEEKDEENDEKYIINEDDKSRKELNRLKAFWRGDDLKLFSQQLSWIFTRCAIIDVATDNRASWYHICKFTQGYRDGTIEERIRHDMNFLDGNHQVYRDEFEQFKATLKCRGDAAISLFYQIRHFCESINWSQISEFLEFIEINLINVEDAIDEEAMGEDEDPTVEELIPLMKIASEVDGNWLFSIVIQRHSNKVSWVEIREYLIDWNEARDEVTEYFDELVEKRDRVKLTEKTLDDITNKLNKIKGYFDENINTTKDELLKKNKDELIELIIKSQWYYSGKQGFKQLQQAQMNQNDDSFSLLTPTHKSNKKSIDLNKSKSRISGKILTSLFPSKN